MSCVRIDVDLKYWAKSQNINISQILNDVLRSLREQKEDNIDLIIIERELADVESQIVKLKEQRTELFTKKIALEEKQKQTQLTELDELKKQAKAAQELLAVGQL